MKPKAIKSKRSFPFLRVNERETKPRKHGLTEIRGPYYSVVGRRYLKDLFEMMGQLCRFTQICRRLIHSHAQKGCERDYRSLSQA
jgi:hypothetical protein